jgi:hypothetical protein
VDNQLNMNRQLHALARSPSASLQLLARSKRVATAGLPILQRLAPGIKAEGAGARAGEFATIDHVRKLASRKGRGAAEFVEHADHSFANPPGREAVKRERHLTQWMASHFPLPHAGPDAESVAASHTAGHQFESRKRQPAGSDLDCAVERG